MGPSSPSAAAAAAAVESRWSERRAVGEREEIEARCW